MSERRTRSGGAARRSGPRAPSLTKGLQRSQRKSGSDLPSVLPELWRKAPHVASARKPIVLKKIVAHAVELPAVQSPRRSPRRWIFHPRVTPQMAVTAGLGQDWVGLKGEPDCLFLGERKQPPQEGAGQGGALQVLQCPRHAGHHSCAVLPEHLVQRQGGAAGCQGLGDVAESEAVLQPPGHPGLPLHLHPGPPLLLWLRGGRRLVQSLACGGFKASRGLQGAREALGPGYSSPRNLPPRCEREAEEEEGAADPEVGAG
nr:sororin isoform X4 [Oryctolagus cuniculus]